MKPEDVPAYFAEQVKISPDCCEGYGVNNIFERIDLKEIDNFTSLLFNDDEMKVVRHKADLWNISFNGEDHQNGDRIFWFYILSDDGSRVQHTCNHRQFDELLQKFEFVSYHDYENALEKCTDSFRNLFESDGYPPMCGKSGKMQYADVTKLFPIFKEKTT